MRKWISYDVERRRVEDELPLAIAGLRVEHRLGADQEEAAALGGGVLQYLPGRTRGDDVRNIERQDRGLVTLVCREMQLGQRRVARQDLVWKRVISTRARLVDSELKQRWPQRPRQAAR